MANSSTPEALLLNLTFLQRMADVFEEQGNYAECVRSAESALLLRQANAPVVAAILATRQQQQQPQQQQHVVKRTNGATASRPAPAAAAPRKIDVGADVLDGGMVALTDKGDVQLPLGLTQQATDLVRRCNSYAVAALRHDRLDSAAFFLNRAMFLTDGNGEEEMHDVHSGAHGGLVLRDGDGGANFAGTSDRWWWRGVMQAHHQQQQSNKARKGSDSSADDGDEDAESDVLDLSSTNANVAGGATNTAAAALRACFQDTSRDQQRRLTLRAATLNHLGCLEHRRGRLGAAVIFFRMAIRTATQLESTTLTDASDDVDGAETNKANMASTYLNLCTVLNAMGRHAEAVQACERVVPLLQQALQEAAAATPNAAAAAAAGSAAPRNASGAVDRVEETAAHAKDEVRVATMLVVAYYNLGVSLERRDAGRTSDAAPQRAFQQAVHVTHGYHLVPPSCRGIEAVMAALRHPHRSGEKTESAVRSGATSSPSPPPQELSAAAAVLTTAPLAVAAQQQPSSSQPQTERRFSSQPPTHALPRITALSGTTDPSTATRRLPPSPPPPPSSSAALMPSRPASQPRQPMSPVNSNSTTLAPTTAAATGAGGGGNSGSTATASVVSVHAARPPLRHRVSAADARVGSASVTASPSSPAPPSAASTFTVNNAWSSPFAAAPPAVLAPLPPSLLASTTTSSRTPPPPVPPPAIFARANGGAATFAATAPPALTRPTGAAMAMTAAAATSASQPPSNPFGRRTFGSTLPLPVGRTAGIGAGTGALTDNSRVSSARDAQPRGAAAAAGALTSGGTIASAPAAGGRLKSFSSRGPRDRLAAATESGRGKQQQQQPRSKRQKSVDRRQQRETAAVDAVLAERMYQQLVSEKEKTEVERCRRAAVQIQRVWRGVLARTWVATLIRAAVCLQQAVRRFLVKARIEHARVAAEQARLRAEESARQEAACRTLQGRVRQFLRRLQIRREFRAREARLFYAARTIQRGYRAFCAQRAAQLAAQAEAHRREDAQRCFREKVAARRIQHAYQHYKTKRAELDAYQVRQRRIRSVVRIQAVVRGYLTRAWYAYYRVYRREQEVRSAAMQARLVVIQSACRAICSAYYGQQRALQTLLHLRESQRQRAATTIQCMWRCHVAKIRRERLQAEHDRDVRHATRIQRWYRMRTQRRAFLLWRAEQQRARAAARLQRWVRACWQAAKAREFAAYHAETLRQQQLQRLQARSIVLMQACANAWLSGRLVASVRDTFDRNDGIARRWQRVGRGFAARRDMALERRAAHEVALKEKVLARRTAAARVVQRAWRSAAAKEKVASMRREAAAASVVARAYRVYRARVLLSELRARREQQRQDTAARRIQQAVRGFLYGQRAREMDAYYRAEHHKTMRRLRRAEAAVMIQAQWRGYVTRRAVHEEHAEWLRLSTAASRIQRAWAARLARRQLRQTLAERIVERAQDGRAALKLQCFWRKTLAARRVAELRVTTRQRTAAVLALQSWWRTQLARREFARRQQRRREEAALEVYYAMQWESHATLINAFVRQRASQVVVLSQLRQQLINLLTEEGRRRFLSRHEAATKIQALFRGHYERYYVRGLRAQLRDEQRRAAELLARQQRAAVMIQCAYRSAQARQALAELRQAEFDRVQASHADYLESADPSEVVRELFWLNSTYQQREAALRRKKEAERRRDAAARIQRLYRRHRARRVVAAAFQSHQQERAARLLQDYWRHHRDVRRVKENLRRQAAATRLQSHIRGWMVRRSWPLYRASIEAERQERVLVQDVLDHAAIVLQCFWRRIQAQRTAARLRGQRLAANVARAQLEAANVIQETFRNYQRRRKMTGAL